MTTLLSRWSLVAVIIVSLGMTGCMEVEQTASAQKQGKYQGKPDTAPWDSAPLASGAGNGSWTKGDKVSWEDQIKARNTGQNEYSRIGH